jgi:Tfp pilus assembly protein PilV
MITTIPSPTPPRKLRRIAPVSRAARGFTLTEVMIAGALSSFILAGVLSTFLFLGRSGMNVQNYNDMEAQSRKALEIFAEDVRQASAIAWPDRNTVSLNVNTAIVVYGFDTATNVFYRVVGGTRTALVTGITEFEFKAYSINGTDLDVKSMTTAAQFISAGNNTKQLQISIRATRTSRTVVDATNAVLSARFILRNKIITA